MSLYFSLIKKDKVNNQSEFPIRLNYYFKGQKTSFPTNITVNEKNWGEGNSKNPINKTDSKHVGKNSSLRSLKREVEKVIDLIIVNGKEPLVKSVKERFSNKQDREIKKVNHDYSVIEVFRKYMRDVIEIDSSQLSKNYVRSYKSSSKHIINILKNYYSNNLYFDQVDASVIEQFVNYGIKNKLSNNSIQKLIGHFRTFFNWSLEKDYHKNVGVKFYNKSVVDNHTEKDVIYLFRDEVKKLYELHEIEYNNPKHGEYTNELVVDVLKDGEKRVYTNLEYCRDLFLFQCGLGTRYGDTIKIKIEHFDFKNKEFKIYMEKTNRSVRVPINEMTEKIFRKYSKDKSKDDFLFPKTISGNFYPNQKINVHLKTISELAKLNRLIHRPLRSGKKILKETEKSKQLWEVISTHVGRRTFIKEGIINKIEPYVIMSLVGHKSLRVFEKYFSINDEDRKISSSLFGFVSENNGIKEVEKSNLSIEERLQKLKKLFKDKLIDKQSYLDREKELLKFI